MLRGGYYISDQNAVHFITCTVIQWVDVFSRKDYRDIIVDSLNYCIESKGLNVHAWCLMSNHLHLIVSCREDQKLSDLIRDFKKYTSGMIIQAISNNQYESRKHWMLWIFRKAGENNKRNETFQFWQQHNRPIECTNPNILETRINYLHENPVRAGIVNFEGDYLYSSGRDYYRDEKGLVQIDFI